MNAIRELPLGSFAFVMATGIISVGAHLADLPVLAWALFGVAALGYGVLWLLMMIRFILIRRQMWSDLIGSAGAPECLTIVAGTCVLGSQVVLLVGNVTCGLALWFFGGVLWILLLYAFFLAGFVIEPKPTLERGLTGTWLLATVSTESVAILGTLLASHLGSWRDSLFLISLSLYLLGGFLYALIITMITYRLIFIPLSADMLTPPYWIGMGAEAITVVAGTHLIVKAADWTIVQELLPFLKGLTLFFWVTATWWIPLLLALGVWRHAYQRMPMRYQSQYWSLVFPLGMYATSTFGIGRLLDLPAFIAGAHLMLYVAVTAWLIAFLGLIQAIMDI
ncbi:MAG: tellurite resistance/C4-dicarboxylate transporter family protein [Nitrospira sp.]|nr:tellurite resistance/C4-dicarboxylate transporter family protein [Nitrospira sp.]MDI3461695.1 C4-dicarboxylate transporter/malic acid transport protein [Nitrospira sp.]